MNDGHKANAWFFFLRNLELKSFCFGCGKSFRLLVDKKKKSDFCLISAAVSMGSMLPSLHFVIKLNCR